MTSHLMFPLKLFHERTFSASNVVALCQTFIFTGFIFVISLFLQEVQHYSPSFTGLALLPSFGCALLATSLSGTLMARHQDEMCDGHGSEPQRFGLFWVSAGRDAHELTATCIYHCRPGLWAGLCLTSYDRGRDFACSQNTIGDRLGYVECEQASGWCHRGRDPGNAGG